MSRLRWRLIVVGIVLLTILAATPWIWQEIARARRLIYLPSEELVVDRMLQMAKVTKDDIVYDLGCGDGRIVVTAAQKFGCRGVGIDLNPVRVKESLETRRQAGVSAELVEIREGDALKVPDLERATVVLLYMLPEFMEKLEPQIKARLKPGTRVVAHDYPFAMPYDEFAEVDVGGDLPKYLYLWVMR